MTPHVPPAATGAADWKDGCPHGHVTTTPRRRKGGYYCDTCKQHYEGDQIPPGGRQ